MSTAYLLPFTAPAALLASSSGRASPLLGRPRPRLGAAFLAAFAAPFASRQQPLLTPSRASVTHWTAWKGSMTCSAFGHHPETASAIHRAPSLVTTSMEAR